MSEVACPRCGKSVSELQNLDPAVVAKIRETGNTEELPQQVCHGCFVQLAGNIARGSVLMAREKAREQKKLMLWKSRVNLIRKARSCMGQKMFSDAAVGYEKYIKVLELVFEVPAGSLHPEQFKDSARTQELTIVASAYWDLLRIYDTSPKYKDRQMSAANKLALFLRFTPIYPDIIRKAEIFLKQAKNPEVVKHFLKIAKEEKGKCFIATSAFNSPDATEVTVLRQFRDESLLASKIGTRFVNAYYLISPYFARFLDKTPWLKPPVRACLRGLIRFLALRQ
jgi:hypothetical protein